MKIRKDDMVVVLSGKDNYTNDKDFIEKKEVKAHKVLSVDPKGGKAIVEGVNVATKHQKPRKQGEEGGIIKVSTPSTSPSSLCTAPSARRACASRAFWTATRRSVPARSAAP